MSRRILVVEDEAPIREMLCFVLEQKGYQAVEAEDYDSAVTKLAEPFPDLVLLDWMLPGGSGINFIKHMKREELTRNIPVVMLTARGEEEDKVRGLEVGADDYITKPFSPKELVARLKAVIRRVTPTALEDVIDVQGLKLDPVSHRVCGLKTVWFTVLTEILNSKQTSWKSSLKSFVLRRVAVRTSKSLAGSLLWVNMAT